MNALPLIRHQLNPDLRIKRGLLSAFAVLAIALTLASVALTTASGSHTAKSTADRGQTLIHYYGTGAPPSAPAARPRRVSGEGPSQHFYGLQP